MTLFVDRKKAFEAKFVHDANLDFKTEARRNKMLGNWVADQLTLDGDTSDELIASYAIAGVLPRDVHCIVAKATADLNGKASADVIEAKLSEFTAVARQQIQSA
ncbi:DUF1476 domain-containing protein [Epibacterium ulvae]|uniref:DUF1476 domain-containing protein n=1 Tax=Epibacterium ulvae TaxID=1156985 RepID=UPI001BFC0AA0|nr:DUF1476 domain-containing protein [Epibacterium ulvae]MBT8154604.1 DUF1476 domain-containing protein [Epibacterium ulvae]